MHHSGFWLEIYHVACDSTAHVDKMKLAAFSTALALLLGVSLASQLSSNSTTPQTSDILRKERLQASPSLGEHESRPNDEPREGLRTRNNQCSRHQQRREGHSLRTTSPSTMVTKLRSVASRCETRRTQRRESLRSQRQRWPQRWATFLTHCECGETCKERC